jgi:hypothetical protein
MKGGSMSSINEFRAFVDGLAGVWYSWNDEYGTDYEKGDIIREIKLGPKKWGFEVQIDPSSDWTMTPIYFEYSSEPDSQITIVLPLRRLSLDLLTYQEDSEVAAEILMSLGELESGEYGLEIIHREWILDFLELGGEYNPFAITTRVRSEDLKGLTNQIYTGMPKTVQFVATEIG